MRLEEAYIMRKQECKALQRENSKLPETIEQLRKGAYSDPDKIDHIKQISALTREIQKKDKIIERYKKLYEEKQLLLLFQFIRVIQHNIILILAYRNSKVLMTSVP